MYTDLVMDHFSNPRNVGEVDDADGVGEIGNPICGDVMRITIKVADERIDDVKFKTFGCGAAVATSSMVTEMVMGKTLDEAAEISNRPSPRRSAACRREDALLEPRRRRPAPGDRRLPDAQRARGRDRGDRRAAARGRRPPSTTSESERLRPDDGVLVALSGGVDSAVALLRLAGAGPPGRGGDRQAVAGRRPAQLLRPDGDRPRPGGRRRLRRAAARARRAGALRAHRRRAVRRRLPRRRDAEPLRAPATRSAWRRSSASPTSWAWRASRPATTRAW